MGLEKTVTRVTLEFSMVKRTNKTPGWCLKWPLTWLTFNRFLHFWDSPRFRREDKKETVMCFSLGKRGEGEPCGWQSCTKMLERMMRAFSEEWGKTHAEQTKSGSHYKLSKVFKKTLLFWSCLSGAILILSWGYKDSLHFLALVLR